MQLDIFELVTVNRLQHKSELINNDDVVVA
jgi:hypothetical protein